MLPLRGDTNSDTAECRIAPAERGIVRNVHATYAHENARSSKVQKSGKCHKIILKL